MSYLSLSVKEDQTIESNYEEIEIINKKLNLENYFNSLRLRYSLRLSIKMYKDGRIDSQRYTYCIGILEDKIVDEIMTFTNASKESIEYIIRRNNSGSTFILSLDKNSVKYYLDSGFKPKKVSMISVEVSSKDSSLKIRNYTPEKFDINLLDPIFHCFLPYMNKKLMLFRSDGQKYIRFENEIIPYEVYYRFLRNETFLNFINSINDTNSINSVNSYKLPKPLWFQFCDESFTLYFKQT